MAELTWNEEEIQHIDNLKELGLQRLTLDINRRIEPKFAKENDTKSRGLDIQVKKDNKVIDTTGIVLKMYAMPVKEQEVYEIESTAIDASRGKYEIIYPTVILQAGVTLAEIVLLKDEQIISSKKFKIEVESRLLTDDAVKGHDAYPLFEQLLEAAKAIEGVDIAAEEERERNEVIRQTQEQQRQESMTDIENRFNLLETSQQQDAEVINARTSTIKNKTFDSLNDRLEEIEKEIDKPLYSTPIESYDNVISLPDNTTNGQISGSIKGDTIVNHAGTEGKGFNSSEGDILINQGILENGILTMKESAGSSYKNFKMKTKPLKDNTDYTIIVEVVENTLSTSFTLIRPHELGIDSNMSIDPKTTGLVKKKFITGEVVEDAFQSFTRNSENIGHIKLKNLMILEGDYTNRSVNYTEGTKSIPASFKIKSVGKNLLNVRDVLMDNKDLIEVAEYEGKKCLAWEQNANAQNIKIMEGKFKPNTSYTITFSSKSDSDQYNKGYINVMYTDGTIGSINSRNWSLKTLTTDSKKSISHLRGLHYANGVNIFIDIDSFQIERNNIATEYEPYKEDVAYVVIKDKDNKIVNLNRLPDGISDEIDLDKGECVLNTNKIVLDGSEDWRYVLSKENVVRFRLNISDLMPSGSALKLNHINNVLPSVPHVSIVNDESEGLGVHDTSQDINICISKTRLKTEDVTGFKLWLSDSPITLIYQLAEPEIIPVTVKGNLQGYENGTVYFTSYIKDNFTVNDTKTITLQYPIKSIDKLLKLDTINAKWIEVEGTLSEDGQTMTVSEKGTYKVYGEIQEGYSTNGLKTIITPINLNGQINSNTTAIEKINNKIYTDADLFTAMLLQQEVRITALEGGMTV